ncbi:MAG: hypothetical protein JJU29_09225 [Verrucomicrobia bacterium]|nr:hypothetical protein [Verrucomicrobiota bacterium]MCH8513148.1 hypothetical protein [Kiritimatiellia bacterium]
MKYLQNRMEGTAHRWMVALLLIAGAAVRLLGAWRFRHNLNLDAGVVAIMTKHIAEGTGFPVFFYGQPHMGSLEAIFGALYSIVFGISGFAVCFGTAFVSFWLLPVVYAWGRDVAGKRAGLMALALCVLGPYGFFHYNASPRGGYAGALTFGAFVLMMATRIILTWERETRQSFWHFLLIGIGAGLGWWASQLTTAAILTAGLFLLLGLRQHAFTWRVFVGLGGFLLGSLPLWIYNLRNDWATFALTGSFRKGQQVQALGWFFRDRFQSLMIPQNLPDWGKILLIGLYAALVLAGLWLWVRSCRKKDPAIAWGLSGIYLFSAIFAGLYSSSHFAVLDTPRYFLPMVAPLAVLTGIILSRFQGPVSAKLAWVPMALFLGVHLPILWYRHYEQYETMLQTSLEEMAETLRDHDLRVVYNRIENRSWNFALREEFVFVELGRDVYVPYSREAERSEHFAVFQNYGYLTEFLESTGGKAKTFHAGRWWFSHDFTPPPDNLGILSSDLIAEVRETGGSFLGQGQPFKADRLDQIFRSNLPGGDASLTIRFEEPVTVAGLRLWPDDLTQMPETWEVLGRSGEGAWKTLRAPAMASAFFWSGERMFWGDPFFRLDARFDPVEITELQVIRQTKRPHMQWSVRHLQVLAPGETLPDRREALPALLEKLASKGISFLYADRWEGLRVHELSEGRIETLRHPQYFPEAPAHSQDHLAIDDNTALLALRPDAPNVREALNLREVAFQEENVGPWVLFLPEGAPRSVPGLFWNGVGLTRIDALWGRHLHELGRVEEALALHPWLEPPPEPERPLDVRFRNGAKLLGLRVDRTDPAPGEVITLTYDWEVPPDLETREYAVFVHFRRERNIFQDDHVFMSDIDPVYLNWPGDSGRYRIERQIRVPEEFAPGEVTLRMGLYHRVTGEREKARTSLPERKGAVEIPIVLQVGP